MSTVRQLLECLGRESLVRLMRERGLSATRTNEARRERLARSYRGDVEALIQDLNRDELVSIFRRATFTLKDEELFLPSPGKYRLDELRAFALRAFAGRRVRIPGDFRPVVGEDGEEDDSEAENYEDEDYEDEDEDYDDEDEDEYEDDDEVYDDEDDDEDGRGNKAKLASGYGAHRDLTAEWSRPRMISRVLQKVDKDVPRRLRTARFQRLLAALREQGIEACLADDATCTPLMENAASPGITAKLRLRIAAAGRPPHPVRGRNPSASTGEVGPAIVLQTGERPVSQRIFRPGDYQLALLRLQLLTAVPSAERRRMPEWPDAYLTAATRGLELRREEESLLRIYSTSLCFGNHSPHDAIPQLAQVLSPSEWEQLLDDFVALNPFQLDMVRAIVEQVTPITTPRSETRTWQSAVPIAEDLRESPPAIEMRAREPLAASGRGDHAPDPPKTPATNVRDLGALAAMFDDE